MPYAATSDLPPAARRLPLHAQEIFLAAFNGAWQTYADRGPREQEEMAFASPGPRSRNAIASAATSGSQRAGKVPTLGFARANSQTQRLQIPPSLRKHVTGTVAHALLVFLAKAGTHFRHVGVDGPLRHRMCQAARL